MDATLRANLACSDAGTARFYGYWYFTCPASLVGWEVPR